MSLTFKEVIVNITLTLKTCNYLVKTFLMKLYKTMYAIFVGGGVSSLKNFLSSLLQNKLFLLIKYKRIELLSSNMEINAFWVCENENERV